MKKTKLYKELISELQAVLEDEQDALRCWRQLKLPADLRLGTTISLDKIEYALQKIKEVMS